MRFLRSRVFLVFAAIVLALAGWFWVPEWMAEREWQDYVREQRERGVPWTLAEFRQPVVSAEEDLALVPIFAQPNASNSLLIRLPFLSKKEDGTAYDWAAFRAEMKAKGFSDDLGETDDLRTVDRMMTAFQPIVQQLWDSKAIAANWGDYDSGRGTLRPQMLAAENACTMLHVRSAIDLALGKKEEARQSIDALFRLAHALRKAPTSEDPSQGCIWDASELVREGLKVWGDEELRGFAREFSDWNVIRDAVWAQQRNRAAMRESRELMMANASRDLWTRNSASTFDEWLTKAQYSRRSWWRKKQLWWERSDDERISMLDVEGQVWRSIERKFDPEELGLEEQADLMDFCPYLTRRPLSWVRDAIVDHAQCKMGAIACWLELYRRSVGKYPETLQELIPQYIERLPVDPGTGNSFKYRREPDGSFLLDAENLDGSFD